MEAVYKKTSKNATTFCSGFHGMNTNHNVLHTSPFNLSNSSLFSSASPLPYPNRRDSQMNQPPLLPLPNSRHNRRKFNTISNQQSLSVRKSSGASTGGRERFKHQSVSSNRLGPDPMDVPKFLFSSSSGVGKIDQVAKFSGSVVSTVLSPPPSSLPMPTFSLRPKLCCNAEAAAAAAAAGIDAGATHNLRRILRIS